MIDYDPPPMTPSHFLALHGLGGYGAPVAGQSGQALFRTPELAAQFRRLILDRYHPQGYGTHTHVEGCRVHWDIGNAD